MDENVLLEISGLLERSKKSRTANRPKFISQQLLGDAFRGHYPARAIANGNIAIARLQIENIVRAYHLEGRFRMQLPPAGQP
jgi:hypothetical protein